MPENKRTLVKVKELSLSYQTKPIFENLNFEIGSGQRIGIVGQNGAGKSSLLKILSGQKNHDSGEIIVSKGVKIEYLPQDFESVGQQTAEEYIIEKTSDIRQKLAEFEQFPTQELFDKIEQLDGFNLEANKNKLLGLFQIPDPDKQLGEMSGGERRRIYLVGALLSSPDLLLLDEPTNHLDIGAVDVLESYLRSFEGAVVTISHDRFFLDRLTQNMWEINSGGVFYHEGNYTKYLQSKAARQANEKVIDWKLRQYLKRELEWVNSGVKARGTKDKGRLQRFEEAKAKRNRPDERQLNLILPEIIPLGSKILDVENYNLSLNERKFIVDFTFEYQPWHKIGLVGNNGSGKTTFLRALLKKPFPEIYQQSGTIKIGQNTHFLYLDQFKQDLNPELTPLEYISQGREKIPFGMIEISARKYLENWLFDKERYQTHIRFLSGGEKSRLVLAQKLTQPCNFLILDEPTNDLDLDTIRVLEEALVDFPAPIIVVSHDRSFLNRVCNNIFGFDSNGKIKIVTGNYDDFKEKYPSLNSLVLTQTVNNFSTLQVSQTSYNQNVQSNQSTNPKEERRKKAEAAKLEKEIAKTESRIKSLKDRFDDPEIYKNMPKVSKMHHELEELEKTLELTMQSWIDLN